MLPVKTDFFITGWYRIFKTADVKNCISVTLSDYSCLDEDVCHALRADTIRFVSIENAFEVTPEALKSWNYKARLTKQTRIILTEEQAAAVIDHLRSKPDITATLVAETQRLWPHGAEMEEKKNRSTSDRRNCLKCFYGERGSVPFFYLPRIGHLENVGGDSENEMVDPPDLLDQVDMDRGGLQ